MQTSTIFADHHSPVEEYLLEGRVAMGRTFLLSSLVLALALGAVLGAPTTAAAINQASGAGAPGPALSAQSVDPAALAAPVAAAAPANAAAPAPNPAVTSLSTREGGTRAARTLVPPGSLGNAAGTPGLAPTGAEAQAPAPFNDAAAAAPGAAATAPAGVYPTAAPAPMVILSADLAPAPSAYARPPQARTLVSSIDLVGDQVKPPLDPATTSQIAEVTNTLLWAHWSQIQGLSLGSISDLSTINSTQYSSLGYRRRASRRSLLQASPLPAPTISTAPGSRVQVYITLVPRADVGAAASIGAAFQEAVSAGMMADSLRVAGVPVSSVRGVMFAAYPVNAPVGPSDPSQYPKQGPHKFKPADAPAALYTQSIALSNVATGGK
ncbi:hypothetical protein WJX81_002304 [Elliptochloris bilobata]|uniref:Uncharacterized protein n=1 Tax=Elliptochloris bilobata TaxID=381761 RepID=A0AAW1SDM4_9CHLO